MSLKFLHWQDLVHKNDCQVFALVDAMDSNLPLLHFLQLEGVDAVSILNAAEFSGDTEKGPWVISASKEYLEWWLEEAHAASGILVASSHDIEVVAQHFASLFEAHLGQEWIFFPFYQPDYIGRMLPQFDESEVGLFLGPAFSSIVRVNNQWLEFHHTAAQEIEIPSSPWWAIKPHHLALFDNNDVVLHNLELWLWKKHPKKLAQHISNDADLTLMLKRSFNKYEEKTVSFRAAYAAIQCLFGDAVWHNEHVQQQVINTQHEDMVSALKHTIPMIQENV